MSQEQNRGCLFAFLSMLRQKASAKKALPYRLSDKFISPAELSFLNILRVAAGDGVAICPKVNLHDLFLVSERKKNYSYVGRISQKHVDFVLCDAQTMRPRLAVELDDASHRQDKRRQRDAFVDDVFKAASLPLVRITARQTYSVHEVRYKLLSALQPAPGVDASVQPPPVLQQPAAPTLPLCPKCGIPMVLRTSKRSANAGNNFYACPNYPECREIRNST